MIILLSPTKEMSHTDQTPADIPHGVPAFLKEAREINKVLRGYSTGELSSLMKTSMKIAEKTSDNIVKFNTGSSVTNSAMFAYRGTVFKEADAGSLSRDALLHAEKHLRILSGCYGVLRPFDEICPYRLEMKTPLIVNGKKNLYDYWKKKVTEYINRDALALERGCRIINLASGEYSKMIDMFELKYEMINIHFKEKTGAGLKTSGTYSKKARGQMVRQILINRISVPEKLKEIEADGHVYSENHSTETDWIFIR